MKKQYTEPEIEYIDILTSRFLGASLDDENFGDNVKPDIPDPGDDDDFIFG